MFGEKKVDSICPLLDGKCKEGKCRFWINVKGQNPQSGEVMDRWDCAISWLPVLMIDLSRQQRSTAAAVESFRNETVNFNTAFAQLANDKMKLLEKKENGPKPIDAIPG